MVPAARPGEYRCPQCSNLPSPAEIDDDVTVDGEPVGANCPVCREPLISAIIEEETVCYCDHCGGFCAKNDAFSVIVSKRRARHGPHENRPDPFDPAHLQRVLMCPGCHKRMDTHPYFGGGNVVVDTCEPCSLIWLDAGELAIIERYLPHVRQIEPTLTLPGGRYQGGPFD
jgi:Zn-finger nucleic acid-binding protein